MENATDMARRARGGLVTLLIGGLLFPSAAFAASHTPKEQDPRVLVFVIGFVVLLLLFTAIASALSKGQREPNDDEGAFPIPFDEDLDGR